MTTEECNYIWARSRQYKELLAVQSIALQLKDYDKVRECRDKALDIQKELYDKYKLIL